MASMRLRTYFARHRGLGPLLRVAAVMLALLLLLGQLSRTLSILVTRYVDIRLEALVSGAVNGAILEALEAEPELFSGLLRIERDSAGAVTAVESDTARINRIKTLIATGTMTALERGSDVVSIPIGTLLGGSLLLHRGPALTVRLVPAAAAQTTIVSVFEASGINQTLHRMSLEVEVAISVIRLGSTVTRIRSQQVLLGETVIVGRVPQTSIQAVW